VNKIYQHKHNANDGLRKQNLSVKPTILYYTRRKVVENCIRNNYGVQIWINTGKLWDSFPYGTHLHTAKLHKLKQ